MKSEWLESRRAAMAREKATRSRWDSGVKVAALQMEMIFWGSFSVLSWARRDRVLSLEEG